MRTTKQILMELFWHLIGWAFSFALIYWLATDNLWLCFFISSASSTAQFAITNTKRDIIEMLLPISQSYDDNINSLYERTQNLESEIEELKELISELQSKLDNQDD